MEIPLEVALLVGATIVVFSEFMRWAWRVADRKKAEQ